MPPQHELGSDGDLLAELRSSNAYFDSIANMIPARLYVAGASGDDAFHPKYKQGQHKESKEARRARNKVAKREKFDPEKAETTLEAKRRLKREMEEQSDSDNDDDEDVVMSDGDGEEEGEGDASGDAKRPTEDKAVPTGDENGDGGGGSYASRIEMLRAKLHAKMAEKRAAAGKAPDDGDGGADKSAAAAGAPTAALVSKRAARRAEKKRRKEAAEQRNKKKAHTSAERGDKQQQQRVVNLGGSTYNDPASKSAATATAAGDLATIDYQSLAGLKPKLGGSMDNKSLGAKKKKSLEKLLADAEHKQARLKELKKSGVVEDREKAKNMEWGEAFKVAEGANSRKTNDPKLLKKAIKRKAKKKAASVKAWNVRLDQTRDAASKRQQIRTHNLESRKQGGATGANLSSKRIVEKDGDGKEAGKDKKGRQGPHSHVGRTDRNRAGFEGKKSGFINGGGKDAPSSAGGGGGGKGKQ